MKLSPSEILLVIGLIEDYKDRCHGHLPTNYRNLQRELLNANRSNIKAFRELQKQYNHG